MAYAEVFKPSSSGTSTTNGNVNVRLDAWAEKAESTTGTVTVYNSLQLKNTQGYTGSYYTTGATITSQIRPNSSASTTNANYDAGTAYTIPDWTTIARSSISVTAAINGNVTFQVSGKTSGSPTSGSFDLSWYDVTLTGVLTAKHTVSFNVNGGTGTYSNLTKKYGTAFSMPNDPTRTNYTFAGWKSNISGDSNTRYGKASGFSSYTHDQYGGTVTLTAQWTQNLATYSVTLNGNGGGWPHYNMDTTRPMTVTESLTTNSCVTAPRREGYRFLGMYTAANGGAQVMAPVDNGEVRMVSVEGDYWTANTSTVTIGGYTYHVGSWKGTTNPTWYAHWEALPTTQTYPSPGDDWHPGTLWVAHDNIWSFTDGKIKT